MRMGAGDMEERTPVQTVKLESSLHRVSIKRVVRWVSQQRILIVLLLLCAIVTMLIPAFMTVNNLLNVARQVSIFGIVAVGMTFVIISGGIDISVGSVVAFGGVVACLLMKAGVGIPLAVLIALLSGWLVGIINGILIAHGRILPFVATLGTMNLIRGLALVISGGQAIWGLPQGFVLLGSGWRLTPHFCEASSSLGFEAYESRVPQHSSPGSFCRRGSSVTRRGGLVPSALNAKSA